jgi:hypothetical protein
LTSARIIPEALDDVDDPLFRDYFE